MGARFVFIVQPFVVCVFVTSFPAARVAACSSGYIFAFVRAALSVCFLHGRRSAGFFGFVVWFALDASRGRAVRLRGHGFGLSWARVRRGLAAL